MKSKLKIIPANVAVSLLVTSFLFLPSIFNANTLGTYVSINTQNIASAFTLYLDNSALTQLRDGSTYKGSWYVKYSNKTNLFDIYVQCDKNSYMQLRKEGNNILYYVHDTNQIYYKQ